MSEVPHPAIQGLTSTLRENIQRRDRHHHTRSAKLASQLVQRDAAARIMQRQDRGPIRLDPT